MDKKEIAAGSGFGSGTEISGKSLRPFGVCLQHTLVPGVLALPLLPALAAALIPAPALPLLPWAWVAEGVATQLSPWQAEGADNKGVHSFLPIRTPVQQYLRPANCRQTVLSKKLLASFSYFFKVNNYSFDGHAVDYKY